VAWRVADDEAVLLHADTSAYFGLNQTGTRLWARLAEHPMSVAELARWARASFSDAPADPTAEISAFMTELHELKLVLEAPESESPPPAKAADDGPLPDWETPMVERFGELEKLILSGE
jgi:PqqD family protein of HPr-rel-A system